MATISQVRSLLYQSSFKANTGTGFLDANVAQWKSENDKDNGNRTGKWTSLFRTALKLEIAMFESALEK